jgi:hypothetical protein
VTGVIRWPVLVFVARRLQLSTSAFPMADTDEQLDTCARLSVNDVRCTVSLCIVANLSCRFSSTGRRRNISYDMFRSIEILEPLDWECKNALRNSVSKGAVIYES